MGDPKISTLLIALVIVGGLVTLFSTAIIEMSSSYDINYTANSNLTTLNKMADINAQNKDIQGNLTQITQPSGFLDTIGAMFSSGYKIAQQLANSVSLTQSVAQDAATVLPNDGGGVAVVRNMLNAIILIIIIIAILLAVLLKWKI